MPVRQLENVQLALPLLFLGALRRLFLGLHAPAVAAHDLADDRQDAEEPEKSEKQKFFK